VCLHLCAQKLYLLGLLYTVDEGTDLSECHTPEDWKLRTLSLMCMCPGIAGSAFTYWEDPDLSL